MATNLSSSLLSILIPNGAHHVDLMFSHPADPPDIVQARAFELDQIARWISECVHIVGLFFKLLFAALSSGERALIHAYGHASVQEVSS